MIQGIRKFFSKVRLGRIQVVHKATASMIHSLRVSPLPFITSPSKSRLILESSLGEGGDVGEHLEVNRDTKLEAAPEVRLHM